MSLSALPFLHRKGNKNIQYNRKNYIFFDMEE